MADEGLLLLWFDGAPIQKEESHFDKGRLENLHKRSATKNVTLL